MNTPTTIPGLWLLAPLALLLGCGDTDAASESDASLRGGQSPPCDVSLEAGATEDSDSGITVEVMQTAPNPPARFLNDWQIRIRDESNEGVSGATLDVEPFMPAHGHGANRDVLVNEQDEAGLYSLEEINLWMGGRWEVRIDFEMDGLSDGVIFDVCIPE